MLKSWRKRPSSPANNSRAVESHHGGTAKKAEPASTLGTRVIAETADAVIDVIFIHGVTGDREKTWTADSAPAPWPETLLTNDLPHARLILYGYDADVVNFWSMASQSRIGDHAQKFLTCIANCREEPDAAQRPIVFVAHSLGGIVCQDALLKSKSSLDSHTRLIFEKTSGIIFMGTPHCGSGLADWAVVGSRFLKHFRRINVSTLQILQADSEVMERIRSDFQTMIRHRQREQPEIRLVCFFEELPMPVVGPIVPKSSATIGDHLPIGIHGNHSTMTKFGSGANQDYRNVLSELRRIATPTDSRQLRRIATPTDSRQHVESKHSAGTQSRGPSSTSNPGLDQEAGGEAGSSGRLGSARNVAYGTQWNNSVFEGPVHIGNTYGSMQMPAQARPWRVTRTANPLFTGRDAIVEQMRDALVNGKPRSASQPKRFVITGQAGIGKSEICLNLANLLQPLLWGVFWIDGRNDETLLADYLATAKGIGSAANNIDDARQALARQSKKWLLILDNADHPETDYLQCLPTGMHGWIVIASRNSSAKRYSTVGSRSIPPLPMNEAQNLLFKAADIGAQARKSLQNDATEIINILGSHTLAITVAGSLIANGYVELTNIVDYYEKNRGKIHRYAPETLQSEYGSVYATFDTAASVLESRNSTAAKDSLSLVLMLGHLHYADLPLDMFKDTWYCARAISHMIEPDPAEGIFGVTKAVVAQLPTILQAERSEWDSHRFRDAINLLSKLGLVNVSENLLSVHPLIHSWAQDRLTPDLEQQDKSWFAVASIWAVLSISQLPWWPYEHRQDALLIWRHKKYLRLHIQETLRFGLRLFPEGRTSQFPLWRPLIFGCAKMSHYTRADRDLATALAVLFEAEGTSESLPIRNCLHLHFIQSLSFYYQGEYDRAQVLMEKVVASYEASRRETDPWLLVSKMWLASVYIETRKLEEAKTLSEQARNILSTGLSEDNPILLEVDHSLAIAYLSKGQIKEAIEIFKHIVEIWKKTLAEDHPDRLASEHELTRAYLENEQITEAIEGFEHIVEIFKKTLAEDHHDRLASEHNLASAYLENEQITEAIEGFEHIVEIRKKTVAEDHPNRLASEHQLARAYLKSEQIKEAIEGFEHVVEIRKKTLAEDHPRRLASEYWLAEAHRSLKGQKAKKEKKAASILRALGKRA